MKVWSYLQCNDFVPDFYDFGMVSYCCANHRRLLSCCGRFSQGTEVFRTSFAGSFSFWMDSWMYSRKRVYQMIQPLSQCRRSEQGTLTLDTSVPDVRQ
jgi:hypothetical protein